MLEAGVRITSPPSPFSPLLPLRPIGKRELHAHLRGIAPVSYFSTNQWGMRRDEPPKDWKNDHTILTIGGSTTRCYHLDDHKTWPYLLQKRLKQQDPKIWIGNGGLPSQSTRGHILFMKEVIRKIKPKAVIFLVGVNDLSLSISEDQPVYDQAPWRFILFQSRLFQILYTWKLILFDKVTVESDQGHGNYEPIPLTDPLKLPDDPRSLLSTLPEYRDNLKTLIRLAREMKVEPLFLTQPLLFDDTEAYQNAAGSFYWMKKTKGNLSAADYARLLPGYL